MKKILLSAACLLPLALMAQKPFTVNGTTKSLKEGDKVYLVYPKDGQRETDSTVVSGNKFSFKGEVTDPVMANVFSKINPYDRSTKKRPTDYIALYLEPGTITLISADSLKNAKAGGTKANIDNTKLIAQLKPVTDKMNVINEEYAKLSPEQKQDQKVVEEISKRFEVLQDETNPIYLSFAKANPASYVSLASLNNLSYNDKLITDVEAQYAKLSPDLKATKMGKSLEEKIAAGKKTAVGVMAMDFTQNDADGKPIKLSDFKGKYVLVDFWASWCGPCRGENPNVVAAYNKFKDKNFTILGVSLDGGTTNTTKEAWLKAVADDGLTWAQVSDLNGWQNEVSKAWGISSIPANFLIDPTGKIVGKGLRGEELTAKLSELLDKKSK